jgi:hypothetical protein
MLQISHSNGTLICDDNGRRRWYEELKEQRARDIETGVL